MNSVRTDDVPEDEPRPPETTTAPDGPRSGAPRFLAGPRCRRTVLTYVLAVLIPLAVVAAAATLVVMAGTAAAATGGCGGG
jgi:hypothetical protein